MTTLIVTPIDNTQPGSYRQRTQLRQLYRQLNMAVENKDFGALVDAQDALDAWVIARSHTDDGTPVVAAFDQVTGDEFDALLGVLMGGSDKGSDPTPSGGSSTVPSPDMVLALNGQGSS